MKKKILILGSTGSIGRRTLDVIRDFSEMFSVVGLSSYNRYENLIEQIEEFQPKFIAFGDTENFSKIQSYVADKNIKLFKGAQGLSCLVEESDCDLVVVATVGFAGLLPTLKAIEQKKQIALANKEVLVTAGHLVMKKAKENNIPVLPIDSEHNAIFQCLFGQDKKSMRRIILTASGGPFRAFTPEELSNVTIKQALNHPTWNMGAKITIDSATLMNKGFEVIEGKHLFDVSIEAIDVVIHPQSVIHSMVEFIDGSILAQMGRTDMYLPIQNTLTYPERKKTALKPLDFAGLSELTFSKPNTKMFPCLRFAYEAGKAGGVLPTAMNAANEIAVQRFLSGEIGFNDIPATIDSVVSKQTNIQDPDLDTIKEIDKISRELAYKYGR